ncbi:MAG: type VI secretion protein IcmF/TssM N-terminal domain-containing protein [Planctomycetota bacterium]|jgi:hypothetical protein
MSLWSLVLNLPRPLQIGLLVLFGGITPAAAIFAFVGTAAFWAFMVCLVVTVAILALVRGIIKWRRKRRADPFEKELMQSSSCVPTEVGKDVAARARLDDMRKKFESGVAVFRERGKDLYSLPWFVIIGEPGSGKTEAIRHCGIGFPPGLQDELQGTGGTINMDWWFTNHAVILDTAGRLTFGEVGSTDTREWVEFLRLLRQQRPLCPINGLLIAIPVDSLVQDSAEDLEHKGGRLARQLDLIQQTLGVRFPVFVVVTKADKLLGFRQFFQDIRDPQLEGQMFGWSNPTSLDEAFDPTEVGRAVDMIEQQLRRRRMGLLLDPVNTESPNGRRTDQVDELFAFPDALDRITSRLKRYLEQIFVAGEWSSKPLFLRGIYFTSSMQHGAALDSELAEAMGVPMESLEESAWTRDRAYFLHDVFMEKVFRERSLVTHAANTRVLQKKRRAVVVGAGLVTVALLAGVIGLAWQRYNRSIGAHKQHWAKLRAEFEESSERRTPDWPIVLRNPDNTREVEFLYRGDTESRDLVELLETAGEEARPGIIEEPAIFAVFAGMASGSDVGFDELRREACQDLFESGVVAPLLEAARTRLEDDGTDWSMPSTRALAQLVEATAPGREPAPWSAGGDPALRVKPLMAFTLGQTPETLDPEIADDADRLQAVAEWLYGEGDGAVPWPSERVVAAVDAQALAALLGRFHASWGQDRAAGGPLADVSRLETTLTELETSENELLGISCADGDSYQLVEKAREAWRGQDGRGGRFAALSARVVAVDGAREQLVETAGSAQPGLLTRVWTETTGDAREKARMAYDALYAAATGDAAARIEAPGEPIDESANPIAFELRRRWSLLEQARAGDAEAGQNLARLDAEYLDVVGPAEAPKPLYRVRYEIFEQADAVLGTSIDGSATLGELEERLGRIEERYRAPMERIDVLSTQYRRGLGPEAAARLEQASTLSACMAEGVGGRQLSQQVLDQLVGRLESSGRPGELVAAAADPVLASERELRLPLTALAGTGVSFDPSYHWQKGAALLRDWIVLCDRLAADEASGQLDAAMQSRLEKLRPAMEDYARDYVGYWTEDLLVHLRMPDDTTWERMQAELAETMPRQVADELELLAERSLAALDGLDGHDDCLARSGDKLDVARRRRDLLAAIGCDAEGRLEDRAGLENVLRNWQRLGAEPQQARVTMLERARYPDFLADYFILDSRRVVARDLTIQALNRLADAARGDAQEAATRLPGLVRFPLRTPNGPSDQMQVEALGDVRGLLGRLTVRTDLGDAELRGLPEEIRGPMRRLASPAVSLDSRWVDRLQGLIAELPADLDTAPYEVQVWAYLPEGVRSVSSRWRDLGLVQGRDFGAKRHPDRGGDDRMLGTLACPGPDVQLNLWFLAADDPSADGAAQVRGRRSAGGEAATAPLFKGPWGVLLMLYDFKGQTTDNGKTWTVQIPVVAQDVPDSPTWQLALRLVFDPPLRLPIEDLISNDPAARP